MTDAERAKYLPVGFDDPNHPNYKGGKNNAHAKRSRIKEKKKIIGPNGEVEYVDSSDFSVDENGNPRKRNYDLSHMSSE